MSAYFKQFVVYFLSIFSALLVFVGIAIVYAWTEPAFNPPAGNVSAPVNVGNAVQYKTGNFGVEGVFQGNIMQFLPVSEPASPVNGMIYYDSSLNKFRCRENGAWKNCFGV